MTKAFSNSCRTFTIQLRKLSSFMVSFVVMASIVLTTKAQVTLKETKLSVGTTESIALAGKNSAELEKVIAVYSKNQTDSLRLKAAYYLIDNMKWHKSRYSEIHPDLAFLLFFKMVDSLYYAIVEGKTSTEIQEKQTKEEIKKLKTYIRDTLSKSSFKEPVIIYTNDTSVTDLNTIKAGFLIDQIENAFVMRSESQHVKQLPFTDFCEYVLAYRLIDGVHFRYTGKQFNRFFTKYLGDVNANDFTETVARYNITVNNLRDILGKYPFETRTGFEELFFSGVRGFDCFSISQYAFAALNACGLPVDLEYNTAYQMLQDRHSMCNVYPELGIWSSFSPESGIPVKKTSVYDRVGSLGMMNLLRVHYAPQSDIPYFLKNRNEFIPSNLDDPCIEDVTSKSLVTVSLDIPFDKKTSNKLCYLATYNSASGIIPVTWTLIDKKNRRAIFKNAIPDRLYFPVYYEANEAKSFGLPFLLQYDSTRKERYNIRYVDNGQPTTAVTDLILTKKYPPKPAMIKVAENLVGTSIIAYDSTKGKMDTLYTLDFVPKPYLQEVKINNKKAYKFYRVQSPKQYPNMNISEIEFLTDTSYGYTNVYEPTALPAFSPNTVTEHTDRLTRVVEEEFEKIRSRPEYDGSMETAPRAYPSITLKLKEPQVITTIRFAPLNENNGIVPGNEYLLYYWDNGKWTEFEYPQTAQYQYIEFKGVPKGKLYWLKNRSGGKEELPFMINEKGEQQFIYFDIK